MDRYQPLQQAVTFGDTAALSLRKQGTAIKNSAGGIDFCPLLYFVL